MNPPLDVPVVFLIFNRPGPTGRVFEAIRAARPRQLLVVADGPRPDRAGEAARCQAARAVIERIDWPCDLSVDFAPTNLGCGRRISSGLAWAFERVERAIILEDDCLPGEAFFPFARELLERYATDERVMDVQGTNLLGRWKDADQDFHFSLLGHSWGWATWRRAFQRYDFSMAGWGDPAVRARILAAHRSVGDRGERAVQYDLTQAGTVDTWDYQWQCGRLQHGKVSVIPARNLVSNVGDGADATHTTSSSSILNLPVHRLEAPLRAPARFAPDLDFDRATVCLRPNRTPLRWRFVPKPLRAPMKRLFE